MRNCNGWAFRLAHFRQHALTTCEKVSKRYEMQQNEEHRTVSNLIPGWCCIHVASMSLSSQALEHVDFTLVSTQFLSLNDKQLRIGSASALDLPTIWLCASLRPAACTKPKLLGHLIIESNLDPALRFCIQIQILVMQGSSPLWSSLVTSSQSSMAFAQSTEVLVAKV